MSGSADAAGISFCFPGRLGELEAVRERILKQTCDWFSVGERMLFEWKLVVSEILSNAIEHGSPCGASDRVEVGLWKEGDAIHLEVIQQGGPPAADRKMPEVDALGYPPERGYGLQIVRKYADILIINVLADGRGKIAVTKTVG